MHSADARTSDETLPMRIVITGGAGFLGTRLARKLLERGTLTDASGRAREIASIMLSTSRRPRPSTTSA